MTVIDQSSSQRINGRCSNGNSSSLNAPHITLEIPSPTYYYLSPIHEVPTPLPSPSHTPLPSLRRQDATLESSFGSPQRIGRSAHCCALQDRGKSIAVPDIVICTEDEDTLESSASGDQKSPVPSPKTKPSPLKIFDSNFARFDSMNISVETTEMDTIKAQAVPTLCILEPSPEDERPPETEIQCYQVDVVAAETESESAVLNWQRVNIGSPPVRRNSGKSSADVLAHEGPLRRILRDSGDKSSSLDLAVIPPMITITTNFSEAESDIDPDILGKFHRE